MTAPRSTRGGGRDPVSALWAALASARLAAAGLGLLSLALLLGALLPQVGPTVRADAAAYAAWLQERREGLGAATPLLDRLGLFAIHRSWWFRLLLTWLGLSLGVYVLSRLEPAWRRGHAGSRWGAPFAGAGFVPVAELTVPTPVEEAVERAAAALRSLGYKVRGAGQGERERHLRAERNRWYRLANVASHLGAAVLLLAAAAGHVLGWQEPALLVPEGDTVEVGHGTALSVRNNGFSPRWYASLDAPRDYVTDVTLLRDGAPVREHHLLRVNSPVSQEGVSFHQAFFGPAVRLRVRDAGGRELYAGGVALAGRDPENRPAGALALPGYRLEVLAPRLDGTDRSVPAGTVRLRVYRRLGDTARPLAELNAERGRSVSAGGLTVLFERESRYSGLHVTYNPAVPYVWGGAVVMLGGMMYAFALPYRRVRVRVVAAQGGSLVSLSSAPGRPLGLRAERERVLGALERALTATASGAQDPASTAREGRQVVP